MKEPLISVIVPIYNVEKYLDRCIESIVNQTYSNLEIILVDDGSPDNCPRICDDWAEKDNRIKVVHKENGGLSDARNAGLLIATGEFVSFIDSDDFIEFHFYEILLLMLNKTHADIAACGFLRFSDQNAIKERIDTANVVVLNTEEALIEIINYGLVKQVVWNKLYKKSVVEGVTFDIGKIHEDTFWSYKIFGKARQTVVVNDYLGYYYFQRNDSITGQYNPKSMKHSLEARLLRLEYLKQNFPSLVNTAKFELFCHCLGCGQDAINKIKGKKHLDEAFSFIKRCIKESGINFCEIFSLSKKYSVWFVMSKISIFSVCKIRNYLKIGY